MRNMGIKNTFSLVTAIAVLLLLACGPTDEEIDARVEAKVSEIPANMSKPTPITIPTSMPTATREPEARFSPTATRVIIKSPETQIKDWIKGLRKGTVSRVIDGDTIELVSGEKIRYLEVSTPEIHNSTECYGQEANIKNIELVLGKTIYIQPPTEGNKTSYNRTLAYVFTDEYFVNKKLVEEGYAIVELYAKPNRFYDILKKSEDEVKFKNLGLWNKCNSVKP